MRSMFLLMVVAATMVSIGAAAAVAEDAIVYGATYVEVAPGAIPQGIALLKALHDASRKEDGNLGFFVVQEHDRPNRFVAMETWKDQASLDAHRKGKAYAEFNEKLMSVRTAPPDERVHNALAPSPSGLPAPSRGSVWVVTHVDVPPPSKDACIAELKTLAEASRKDAGNLAFGVVQQTNRPNHFTVVEVWQDQKALDAHAVAEPTKKFRAALGPMLGAPHDDRVYAAME
ncbi:MAG: antibiotic biosynthesis monooxygenase [Hyphomicrobiales bacterium]|nr:antibiotic biosynthesis monooxygenase [Hyphomicrobiales bacterium]MBV9429960.1 antibiotic biosynthesis monooxygenase [Bradyrhizobiaceae bacterium]